VAILGSLAVNRRSRASLAAFMRQHLRNKAWETGQPFNEMLQYLSMESLASRLLQSAGEMLILASVMTCLTKLSLGSIG
jgi:hypothetical protein